MIFKYDMERTLESKIAIPSSPLPSCRHTGFSVHNGVRVEPEDGAALERLARYILRPPISLERMRWSWRGWVWR